MEVKAPAMVGSPAVVDFVGPEKPLALPVMGMTEQAEPGALEGLASNSPVGWPVDRVVAVSPWGVALYLMVFPLREQPLGEHPPVVWKVLEVRRSVVLHLYPDP